MSEAAISGTSALAANPPSEASLARDVSLLEQQALEVAVVNDSDYSDVGDFLKEVAARKKFVTEFWEPMRKKTYAAYNEVLSKKKAMLAPLEKAEKILKGKMSAYLAEVERKRREQEETMRRLAQQEAERKLQEAAQADNNGDSETAEAAFMEAEIMDGVAASDAIPAERPKASGVSASKDWRIVSIVREKVPVMCKGVELRPVDERAVLRLIKASKGTVRIPGVEYEEVAKISVRSR